MRRFRLLQGISGEECDDGAGLARKSLKNAPLAVVNGCGAPDAALSEVFHETEKEGQVFRRDAFLVDGQDELAVAGAEKEVAVLDAFRDPLEGGKGADIIALE